MSKEKILEEFELKLHNVYATIFQLSGYDDKQLKEKMYTMTSFLSKAIDQTEEETIRECEELLPEEYETPWNSIDAETCMIQLGYNEAVKEIKQSLNKLKK